MTLEKDILEVLKKYANKEDAASIYINPTFLSIINLALYDYYDIEDDKVDDWIRDMWGH